jgi:hypothetical protein
LKSKPVENLLKGLDAGIGCFNFDGTIETCTALATPTTQSRKTGNKIKLSDYWFYMQVPANARCYRLKILE